MRWPYMVIKDKTNMLHSYHLNPIWQSEVGHFRGAFSTIQSTKRIAVIDQVKMMRRSDDQKSRKCDKKFWSISGLPNWWGRREDCAFPIIQTFWPDHDDKMAWYDDEIKGKNKLAGQFLLLLNLTFTVLKGIVHNFFIFGQISYFE